MADAAMKKLCRKNYAFPPRSVNKFAAEFQAEVPENEKFSMERRKDCPLKVLLLQTVRKQNYTDTHADAHARPPGRLFNCVHVSSVQL
ncbi:RING finger protein [Trichinella spiralis]|uniref:RING finger protein n=1 Tax=Trichinella spiralis TaxID=6334 RepID=A0ABR3KTC9_TRISP